MEESGSVQSATSIETPSSISSEGPLSAREAAQMLSKKREENNHPTDHSAESQSDDHGSYESEPDESQPSGSVEDNGNEPEFKLPPIDPPSSWNKEEKERFRSLPYETQKYLSERENERDREIRRVQNETAEAKKNAISAKESAEAQRQQYEKALPEILQYLQAQTNNEFSDIKTFEDITRMAEEDPFRYAKWDAQQKQLDIVKQEYQTVMKKQQEDFKNRRSAWEKEQDGEFSKYAPEFSDPKQSKEAMSKVQKYLLEEIGIPENGLKSIWNGDEMVDFRNAKVQRIIYDAARYHHAKQQAKQAVAQNPPPALKPGSANTTSKQDDRIAQLNRKLNSTGSARDAAALLMAQRAASSKKR